MMHVRGRAASKDDLELARRSALAQEKISFGAVTHVEPMGGYGRKKTAVKRPATAQTRRPTRPTSGRARPQSAQVQRSRPISASRTVREAPQPDRLRRGRISPDLIDDAPADPAVEEPPRIYDRQRARAYLPPAGVVPDAELAKPAPRPMSAYREKVPRVGCAVPLPMPEVDGQQLPAQGAGTGGSNSGAQGAGQASYPDILLLESWISEMAERVLVNKQQEVFSKVMFDRSLLSYTMDAKHGEAEVHNMWSAAERGLNRLGCTREQLYARHLDSAAVERLYRALYIYSVGLPTAVKQLTAAAAAKEPSDEPGGLPVLCLSSFLHLFMEVLKSTHGDSVATQVEDNFVSGVHARVQAYMDSLDALKLEHAALQQRFAILQAEVDENGGESNVQKIKRMNEAIYDLQQKIKSMMKSQAAAIVQMEDEVETAENEAAQAKKREAAVARLAAEERQQAAAREKELQAEIDQLKVAQVGWQAESMQSLETMVDEISRLRNERWVSSGSRSLPKHTRGTATELLEAHAAAITSIVKAVASERDDVAFKKERDLKSHANKEQQRERELEEERKAAAEALLEQQRNVRREQDAKERLADQLARADLLFARERATVMDCRRLSKRLAVHQFAKWCIVKRKLKRTNRSLHYAEKAAEQAIEEKEVAVAAQESARDRRKHELGESLEGQHKQLAAMLAEVEKLKFELQDSKSTLASKKELQTQVEAGHKKIRELLTEIERLNSVHSGEMATREMHIGRIEVQLQAAHSSSQTATAELRQARAEHVAYVAQASMRRDKMQNELDKTKAAKKALTEWREQAEIRELADKQSLEELETKLENEQTLDRDLQGKLRADVDRLEKALQKAEFAAQRQQQMREDKALEAKRERAVLQKQIDGHDDAVAKLNTSVQQQKRLFNAMRDERDLVLSTCGSLEQSLMSERRTVIDSTKAKADAERNYQNVRREIKTLVDARDEAIGRMKAAEEQRVKLERHIDDTRQQELARIREAKIRRKAAMQAEIFSTADVGVQADPQGGPSNFEMSAFLEELRVAEAARDKAEKKCEQAKKAEREALNSCVALKEEIERLAAGLVPPADVRNERRSLAEVLKEAMLDLYEDKLRALGCAVASDLDNVKDSDLAELGMTGIEVQRLQNARVEIQRLERTVDPQTTTQGGEPCVDVEPSSSELPENLSSLMHDGPPEYVRYMSLKTVLSLVRQLYAHCSQVLQECVGPSMQSIGECIYQFFELKYGRAAAVGGKGKYGHELHIYEFISSVLRLSHESPALTLFARFAGVVGDVDTYSVEAFRFFLYVMSCLDTSSLLGQQGARPKVFSDLGSTSVRSGGTGRQVQHAASKNIWLSEEYAMEIFRKVIPDERFVQVIEFELRSVLSHRPSRQNASVTPCIEQDSFLLKVMELWNEITPTEDGGSLVKRVMREDMLLRSDDTKGVSQDIAALHLDRWRSLGEPADGIDRRKVR
jgi:hypothetical protein